LKINKKTESKENLARQFGIISTEEAEFGT
jgi:hypothetical protein